MEYILITFTSKGMGPTLNMLTDNLDDIEARMDDLVESVDDVTGFVLVTGAGQVRYYDQRTMYRRSSQVKEMIK